ncbi:MULTISPECIES: alpha/beta fold hydrolase [unclassified Streptomyces]|uniref:alpha/beta fold hydrolase n=1 Tax=unclassified Streptomyces TaxID=2593676 RepID=UPI0022B6DDC6|nr:MULTISPECIES: alpha/beta fold hydrolase [unclassified Streptomyces]MCZ7415598.1 alpha/beta fold hydrolase [Streptomyces sp. WMMC897]MCZ7434590.1 alpha/beta fold hydrolase [Streptomyces sp. WMMC1477]
MVNEAILSGVRTAYLDEGAGEPLVLVHGHPFDHTLWAAQTAQFASAGYRVIAPDLRGYGASEVIPGVAPLSDFATDVALLLNRLRVERATLAGVSMGGQIALEFFRLFADRVSRLVLCDTAPHPETEAGRAGRRQLAERLLREGMGGYTEEVIDRMVAPRHVAASRRVRAMMLATSPQGAAAALRGRAERPDYTPVLARVRVPTLVVVGREDTYTPVADAEFLHEHIAGSRLAVIDDAAHLPMVERPEEFNRVLGDFLRN